MSVFLIITFYFDFKLLFQLCIHFLNVAGGITEGTFSQSFRGAGACSGGPHHFGEVMKHHTYLNVVHTLMLNLFD